VSAVSSLKGFVRIFSLTRLLNLALLYTGYGLSVLLKRPVVLAQPFSASVEPVSCCNLSCPQCPVGLNNVHREEKSIDLGFYKEIINEISRKTWYLMLYFQGEPLLHKDFIAMVSHAVKRKMYTVTSTNAQLLSRDMADALVTSGLNRIIISIDGTDQETYAKYRKGGELEKVTDGVRYLVELKRMNRTRQPLIILQFLVFRHNQHQVEEIQRLGHDLGADRVECKSVQIYKGAEGAESTGGTESAGGTDVSDGADLLPDSRKYRRYDVTAEGDLLLNRKMMNRCRRLWDTVVITSDARIVPCCYDKEGVHDLGSLKENGFLDIWKGKEFMAYRKRVLKDRKSIDICNNCTEGLGRMISQK